MARSEPSVPQSSSERAAALQRVALRSRIRTVTDGRVDVADRDLDPSAPAVVVDGHAFYQTGDLRGLGPALRWTVANDARILTLLAEAPVAADLARRAGLLSTGGPIDRIEVWSALGPDIEPATPSPIAPVPDLPRSHLRFASLIAEVGARPVDDHGLLVAEVAGLEVARVVDVVDPSNAVDQSDVDVVDPSDAPSSATVARLSVGVGQADRELQGYVHGHLDDDTNLRRAIAAVVRYRNRNSPAHPLSRLSRQRWLRSSLLDDPGLVGLDDLEPVAPLRPRRTLLSQEPVAAGGTDTVVVCSVGVDLDLLPEAVDYREREQPEADLVVVVPDRDRRLVAGPLAEMVPRLRLVSIDDPWGPRR